LVVVIVNPSAPLLQFDRVSDMSVIHVNYVSV